MILLYQAPLFSNKPLIRLFRERGADTGPDVLFKQLPEDFELNAYTITQSPQDADFFIIPQAIKKITPEWKVYADSVFGLAKRYNKKTILFLTGDLCHEVHIDEPNVIVFKGSEYAHAIRDNEVVFAPFVEDLGGIYGYAPRHWNPKPVVSFCGYAGFPSLRARVAYVTKNAAIDICTFLPGGRYASVYKRGIYFRRAAIEGMVTDTRIDCRFIIRDSFSGNVHTAAGHMSPAALREEYIRSIVDADLILAPKGDANFSSRFYEVLSLGRIPILIDTDMVLPLSETINYSSCVIRVPYTEVDNIGEHVMRAWESLSDERYIFMQQQAREIYRKYLRFDSYFNIALPLLKQGGVKALR